MMSCFFFLFFFGFLRENNSQQIFEPKPKNKLPASLEKAYCN